MKNKELWKCIRDRALTAGFTLVILGLVSVQVFDVAGLARQAYGRDGAASGTFEMGAPSGIVAPVLKADLGGVAESTEPRGLRASLWLAPIASLRGAFGLGWIESVDVKSGAYGDFGSRRELRLRLGGGLMAPLTPSMGVDLHTGA